MSYIQICPSLGCLTCIGVIPMHLRNAKAKFINDLK